MKHSAANGETYGVGRWIGGTDAVARVFATLTEIREAPDAGIAIDLLRQAATHLGADAAVFMSYIRDDASLESFRLLLACDPIWANEYLRNGWFHHDPWLRHATEQHDPTLFSQLPLRTAEVQAFARTAADLGFASAVVAPVHTSAGLSRLGVLSLGSREPGFFERPGRFATIAMLAQALSSALHSWLLGDIRHRLLQESRITPAEIVLLQHEAQGHTSKMIEAALNVPAKTIDCRFQRLNAKLQVPDRRSAVRIARLYGLIR